MRVEASDGEGPWQPATDHGMAVDDQGWALEVTHLGTVADGSAEHRYRVRWYDPTHRRGRRHRFVLAANAGRPELAGDPFD